MAALVCLVALSLTGCLVNGMALASEGGADAAVASLTKCQKEAAKDSSEPAIGSYVPQCDSNGLFSPQQCWASTGSCWCVEPSSGKEIPNTRTAPGAQRVDCSQTAARPLTACEQKRDEGLMKMIHEHLMGEFIPTCTANGLYAPSQFSGSTGYSWCVNPNTGIVVPDTLTTPGTPPVNCDTIEKTAE